MQITLTWDLVIIVFFAMVITYSFIMGMHQSIKIVIASYIAIVSVQGIGNLLERLTGQAGPLVTVLGYSLDISVMSSTKLVLFIGAIIFLSIRGGFEVEYTKETGSATQSLVTGLFGFATAGLLISTLLTFVSGGPLLSTSTAGQAQALQAVTSTSPLMQIMLEHQDLWFSLPAILLLGVGFLNNE